MPIAKRLTILNSQEHEQLYGQPNFSKDERPYFFALNESEENYVRNLRSENARIYFMLQLAYFRAKQIFFDIEFSKAHRDLRFLRSKQLHSGHKPQPPARNTQAKCRKKILELTGYQPFDDKRKKVVGRFASGSTKRSLKARDIFGEIIDFCRNRNIEIPPYYHLCDLVGKVIEREQDRLSMVARRISKRFPNAPLLSFLDDGLGGYEFSAVKREAKNLRYQQITEEIERFESLASVQPLALECIEAFEISSQNVKYLASLASHYQLSSLRSFPGDFSAVILCCYIYFRFQKSNDVLTDAFLNYVSRLKRNANEFAKTKIYEQRKALSVDMKKVADLLRLFTDDDISSDQPFIKIQEQAFGILGREEIRKFCQLISKDFESADSIKWSFYADRHLAFKKNLRPLLKALTFYGNSRQDKLLSATRKFRETLEIGKKLPAEPLTGFIPNRLLPHILPEKKLDPSRYEFALYLQLARRLEGKEVFVKNSSKYLSLAEDLISDEQWENRASYLQSTPFSRLQKAPDTLLSELEDELEERLQKVNDDINQGLNTGIVVKGSGNEQKWSIPYEKPEHDEQEAIFSILRPVNICDVISYVNQETKFLDCFEHLQPRFAKKPADHKNISACLVASGSNLGIQKIAEIADISVHTLATVYRNFLHVDSIRSASDKIADNASGLPAYQHFHIRTPEVVHAAADGQKFRLKYRNQAARHSPKYFHQGVGVVAYTLVANHFPINARTIGAHDHESHFLFDLIFGNKTSIEPDIISTDMHGVNHVNFALLNMFGRKFAPRYRRIQKQFNDLMGFQKLEAYKSLFIEPQRQIDRKLIVSEWDNILRILLSLAMKETSQSAIVRKLSSHQFADRTKRALWELDSIIKSIYLLEYLDDEFLRQDVCKAQNRSESYHQLKRAIASIAGGNLHSTKEADIGIWNECARLLTNCVIYYNTDILSKVLERSGDAPEVIRALNRVSPVAWRHINFLGKYVFRDDGFELNLDEIVATIDLEAFLKAA